MYIHTYIYKYVYIHNICIYTYTYNYIYAHIFCISMYIAHTHACTHACTHTCTHVHAHTHTHAHTYGQIHTFHRQELDIKLQCLTLCMRHATHKSSPKPTSHVTHKEVCHIKQSCVTHTLPAHRWHRDSHRLVCVRVMSQTSRVPHR